MQHFLSSETRTALQSCSFLWNWAPITQTVNSSRLSSLKNLKPLLNNKSKYLPCALLAVCYYLSMKALGRQKSEKLSFSVFNKTCRVFSSKNRATFRSRSFSRHWAQFTKSLIIDWSNLTYLLWWSTDLHWIFNVPFLSSETKWTF